MVHAYSLNNFKFDFPQLRCIKCVHGTSVDAIYLHVLVKEESLTI